MRNWRQAIVAALILGSALARAALAQAEPPFAAPGIVLENIGIYCRPEINGTEAAPDTALGYINLMETPPNFAYRQTEVPARLGISFGVQLVADRDMANVRVLTWKPGATSPESWTTDIIAGEHKMRGFVFEYADELILGPWQMEAYDGDLLLYRVTFQVLPGTELPSVTSDCTLVS